MSIKQNPDTPRTNAELLEICEGNDSYGYVRIGFARELERELIECQSLLHFVAGNPGAIDFVTMNRIRKAGKRSLANT